MAVDGKKATRLDEQVPLAILEAPTPPAELLQDRASSDTATTPAVDRVLSGESDLDPKKPDPDDGDTGMSAEQRAREAKYLTGGAYILADAPFPLSVRSDAGRDERGPALIRFFPHLFQESWLSCLRVCCCPSF